MPAVSSFYLFLDDRLPSEWIVRDSEGMYWIIPSSPNAWEQRQRYEEDQIGSLLPVPGHYKQLLGIPEPD